MVAVLDCNKVSWVKFRSQLALYHETFSVCDYLVVGKDSPLGGPRDSGLGAIPVQNTPDLSWDCVRDEQWN